MSRQRSCDPYPRERQPIKATELLSSAPRVVSVDLYWLNRGRGANVPRAFPGREGGRSAKPAEVFGGTAMRGRDVADVKAWAVFVYCSSTT
ncbi:hypothetical protein [Pyrobaculum sp.]|uniref:hypothetical protein n=1 Tax=Pyrobaculum sp. TaxID=2004705 RepID=UPI003D14CD74